METENLLRDYFERKFQQSPSGALLHRGPVITLSREFGCPSKSIGQQLTEALNHQSGKKPVWKFINKEIIQRAAQELHINQVDMYYLMNHADKGLLEDILISFTKSYASNLRIKKTILNVVEGLTAEGHVVIAGRGSAVLLFNRPDTLHVRLQAPFEWRVENVMNRHNLSQSDAGKLILETDRKRVSLFELFHNKKFSLSVFDVIYNCATLSDEDIVNSIISLMKARRFIE
jgi:cytidylate kinase